MKLLSTIRKQLPQLKLDIRKRKSSSKSNTSTTFSIRKKVFFLVAGIVLISILSNYIYYINKSKDVLQSNAESALKDLADANSNAITQTVIGINQSLANLASETSLSLFLSDPTSKPTEVAKIFSSYMSSNSGIDTCSILDKKGTILFSTNIKLKGADLSKEDYIKTTLDSGTPSQSSSCLTKDGKESAITFSYPISSYIGEPIGAITITIPVKQIFSQLLDVNVLDTKSSFAYVIDKSGVVLFHPNTSTIGTTLSDSVYSKISKQLSDSAFISSLKSNGNAKATLIHYSKKNQKYYASYQFIPENLWSLVIVSSEKEVYHPIASMTVISSIISLFVLIILSSFGFLLAETIAKPINKITEITNTTANLDLKEQIDFSSLLKQNDETASMAAAIHKMRGSFRTIVRQIDDASTNMNQTAGKLDEIAGSVKQYATTNAATSQELSASMEETSATAEEINASIEYMNQGADKIVKKVAYGAHLSKELALRAQGVKEETTFSSNRTKEIYEKVTKQTATAMEQAKSVQKINLLTSSIMDIAEQTNLLALNASIEAARAGDAGRGFAVVANEIGKLARQAATAVNDISSIIAEINQAVQSMTDSLQTTLSFLDGQVITDYARFISVSEQYNSDSIQVDAAMSEIHSSVNTLSSHMSDIAYAVADITKNITEATGNVNHMAEQNSYIVDLAADTYEMVKSNEKHVNELGEIVDQFSL